MNNLSYINNFSKTKSSPNSLIVVVHWNSFCLRNKKQLLQDYIQRCSPDIVMLNEIKLDSIVSNDYLDFPGYNSISKPRNRYGGGVAILVRQGLNYSEDHSLDLLNLELVSINLKLVGKEVKLVSLYNPPNKDLSIELFRKLS